MQGHVSRTADQKNYIYNHTGSRECFRPGTSLQPDCYNLLQKAAYMDRYNLTMFYNDGVRTLLPNFIIDAKFIDRKLINIFISK